MCSFCSFSDGERSDLLLRSEEESRNEGRMVRGCQDGFSSRIVMNERLSKSQEVSCFGWQNGSCFDGYVVRLAETGGG